MMNSNWSKNSHRRQQHHHRDRSSRQLDNYDDRWEERREPPRDNNLHDSYHKYSGEGGGHAGTERRSRSREYSKDSLSRDRRSPLRRQRTSSSEWGDSEKKRQTKFTADDGGDDYRYRREPEEKTNRQSTTESFSRSRTQHEEDLIYRKTTSQDSRHRYQHEEFTYRHQREDSTCRQSSSGYYKDGDGHERSRDRSPERRRSQDNYTKSYAKPRERNDSPSTDHEDHRQNRTRFSLNGSNGQSFGSDVTPQSTAVPEQKSSEKGFQRFLNVLNRGVNVAMLNKMVSQASTDVDERPRSPNSFMKSADDLWSPGGSGRLEESQQNTSYWSESEGSRRAASPLPPHRSLSPKRGSTSEEQSLQTGDQEQSHVSSSSRPESVVEKVTLTPEDENKRRQMQDVLQAIGMDFGFEELGQMSHRIQERLYGKKDGEKERHRRAGSRERDTRRGSSPRLQGTFSSSRSSFSPSTREYFRDKDVYSAQTDVSEMNRQVCWDAEYGEYSSSGAQADVEKCETNSLEISAARQGDYQNPTYSLSEPPPAAPVMPMYSSVNCPPRPYLVPPPALPPALPPSLPPALPSYMSNVGPGLYMPHQPPFHAYPYAPPSNIPPPVAQTTHMLPQHMLNPPPPFYNFPNVKPIQSLDTTLKTKILTTRRRCLQVIDTI